MQRLKQKSLIDLANREIIKHNHQQEREIQSNLSAPTQRTSTFQISKQNYLTKLSKRRHVPWLLLKVSDIQTYTDGYAFKATSFTKYGNDIKYIERTLIQLYDSCGEKCSSYEAQTVAIKNAIELLHQQSNVYTKAM